MPRERWIGYIKDYDGGTLMECRINHKVNYLNISLMIKEQREAVYKKISMSSNSHATVFAGLPIFGTATEGVEVSMAIEDIPGVKEAGWTPAPPSAARSGRTSADPASSSSSSSSSSSNLPAGVSTRRGSPLIDLQAKLGAVLKAIKNIKDSWPFLHPVNGKLVPDYYDIIKEPMDIEKMEANLNKHRMLPYIALTAHCSCLIFV